MVSPLQTVTRELRYDFCIDYLACICSMMRQADRLMLMLVVIKYQRLMWRIRVTWLQVRMIHRMDWQTWFSQIQASHSHRRYPISNQQPIRLHVAPHQSRKTTQDVSQDPLNTTFRWVNPYQRVRDLTPNPQCLLLLLLNNTSTDDRLKIYDEIANMAIYTVIVHSTKNFSI